MILKIYRKILGITLIIATKLTPKHKLMDFTDYLAYEIDKDWKLLGKI